MEALYRKYRPTTFADVVGQEHIERTLKNAIEQDKVSHAYLFCGPRGTGKTTMARILAKALLCEQGPTINPDGTCSECEAIAQGVHPDVYELDAASRTGVENVREEIISRVNYAPTRGTWKVYIIDEVHMLSTAAFNALLKTLEEPPAHVVFILCTTDPQKVPDTIHSRCQRFDFHRISAESIVSRLGAICVEEGVDFEGEALDLIAYRAEGGMRNALTSLEQLMAFGGGHVTLEGAQNLLGSLDDTDVSEIVLAIGKRNAAACFNWIARYVETGADLAQFVRDLAEYIRNLYLLSMAGLEVEIPVSEATRTAMVEQLQWFGEDRLSRLLLVLGDLMKELRVSSNPRLSFEIALTRMVRPDSDMTIEALAERIEALEAHAAAASMVASSSVAAPVATPAPVAASVPVAYQATPSGASFAEGTPAPAYDGEAISRNQSAPVQSAPLQSASPQPMSAQPVQAQSASPQPTCTASVDLTNPAALQRLWHATTSLLRKTNPARGVLFMNAKVSAELDGSGIVVEFSQENTFAYNAAQKKEVRALLEKTLEETAGGVVPYRLSIAGGGTQVTAPSRAAMRTAMPAVPRPAAPAVGSATPVARPVVPATGPATPVADRPSSHPSVQSDQKVSAVASQSDATMPSPAGQPASSSTPSVTPTPHPVEPLENAPSADDQVPLDVYDAMAPAPFEAFSDSQVSAESFGASQVTPSPVPSGFPSSAPAFEASRETTHNGDADGDGVAYGNEADHTDEAHEADEAAQIKNILTATFGQGIKFDELPE